MKSLLLGDSQKKHPGLGAMLYHNWVSILCDTLFVLFLDSVGSQIIEHDPP